MALALFIWLLSYWQRGDYIYINKMNFVPNHFFGEEGRLIYRYIMGFLGIGIVFYLADLLSKTKGALVLAMIGTYSLDIYIIQMLLLEGIYSLWIRKARIHLDFSSAWILYGVTSIITMFFTGLCILISKYGIRKNSLLNQLFLGGRADTSV